MTPQDFDQTTFSIFTRIEYKGKPKKVMSVVFEERLIAFNVDNDDALYWARCENVKLL
jgi:hypothetical protein